MKRDKCRSGTCCPRGDAGRVVEVQHRCAPVVEEGEGDIPSVALLEQGELREEAEVERADVPALYDMRPGLERSSAARQRTAQPTAKPGKSRDGGHGLNIHNIKMNLHILNLHRTCSSKRNRSFSQI